MTKVIKYREEMLGWRRIPGPLRVWRVIEGRKKSDDGKTLRFSIQEIPENRQDDVLDLMCTVFVKDEPICNYLNVIDKREAIEDFRKLWSFALQKGTVVGAFVLDENNSISRLAAVNMTLITCDVTEKTLQTGIEFQSELTGRLLRFMHDLDTEKSMKEVYNVDKGLTAFGLCVDPLYRGQGFGYELLSTRDDMAKAYGVQATTTVFTAVAAQKSAARAGYEVLIERNFVDVKNEDGTEMFPGIPHKSTMLMGKAFSH